MGLRLDLFSILSDQPVREANTASAAVEAGEGWRGPLGLGSLGREAWMQQEHQREIQWQVGTGARGVGLGPLCIFIWGL